MKSPSNYGSENEETTFIRRVASPDRPYSKRRQKKRLAIAGTVTLLMGATVGVGYATLRSAQSATIATPAKQQMAASLVVPDFLETMGDPYFPSFDELDEDGDGVVAYGEYMKDLHEVWAKDKENIANSELPEIVKEDLYDQLNDKIVSDTACVKKAMVPTKKRTLTFNRNTIDSLYYMLEVYCFETPIEIPQKYMEMFPDTEAATSAPIAVPVSGGGEQTVTLIGPPVDGEQKIEIKTGDSVVTTTVQVEQTPSGGERLDIPSTGGETTTITVPENNVPTEGGIGTKTVVETEQGPLTVTIDGPVINDKQEVTITEADGTTKTTTVDVTPMADGKNELEIPSPDGTITTVTVPSTTTEGGGGYPTYPTYPTEGNEGGIGTKTVVETEQGPLTVTIDGPVINDKQEVTITEADGTTKTTTVDVTPMADGKNELEIPSPDGTITTVTVPSTTTEGGGGYPTYPTYPTEGNEGGIGTKTVVETEQGPLTVTIDGPVINDKQEVTITEADGTTKTTTVDVTPMADGKNELEIPSPDGTITTVTVPSTTTEGGGGYPTYPTYPTEGNEGGIGTKTVVETEQGPLTVTIDGPVINDKQEVTITEADGTTKTTTVDVTPMADGKNELEIPSPDGTITTVTVPSTTTEGGGGYPTYPTYPTEGNEGGIGTKTVVETEQGPLTVTIDGPVINDKQEVTITEADGTTKTTTVDVTPMADGKNELEIPSPDGTITTVTVPSTTTEGGGGYPTYPTYPTEGNEGGIGTKTVVETEQGPLTVTIDGPVINDKQEVTITEADGTTKTTTVDVTPMADGKNELEIPSPDGTITTVTVPSTTTEGGGGYPTYPTYPTEGNEGGIGTKTVVETEQGPLTVTIDGPVINDKQEVTITEADGTTKTTTVDVTPMADGKNELEIPSPDGTITTVTVPSTTTEGGGGYPTYPTYPTEGNEGGIGTKTVVETEQGPLTVTIDGPVINDKQEVTITEADGTTKTTTVDVTPMADGKNELEIPSPDGTITTVTVPSTTTEGGGGYPTYPTYPTEGNEGGIGTKTVVETEQGPLTVTIDGPVINDKQEVTITEADGTTKTTTVDVTPMADGKNELEIPSPDGTITTVTVPSTTTEGGGGYPTYPTYPTEGNEGGIGTKTVVETEQGPLTVTIDGPVINDKQEVTITEADGTTKTTTVDVTPMADGKNELEIPSPDGTITTVTVPSTTTEGGGGYPTYPTYPTEGNEGGIGTKTVVETEQGPLTVTIDGPVINDKQEVTITEADGTTKTTTVDVTPMADGKNELEIPSPDGTITTVTVPSTTTEGGGGYPTYPTYPTEGNEGGIGTKTVVETEQGPLTVTIDGPVINDKQEVTITEADGTTKTTTVDVTPMADGKNELEIPSPDGTITTVTVPSTTTEGGGGYPTYPTYPTEGNEGGIGTKTVVETEQGPLTVTIDGPVINDKQEVTITEADGTTKTTTVDVTPMADGKNELEIPSPDGTITTVTVPSTTTEGGGGYPTYPTYPTEGNEGGIGTKTVVETEQGPLTVTIDGPVINDKQEVTITEADGTTKTTTVDVTPMADGKNELEIPSPDGTITTVTVPSTTTEGGGYPTYPTYPTEGNEGGIGTKTVVETEQGPVTVTIDGPIINDKQEVTITTADGTSTTTAVDATTTSDGKTELAIPTGPGSETTTVTFPQPSSPTQREPVEQPRIVDVDTSEGLMKVLFYGPITDGKQSVTLLKFYGNNMPEQLILDVTRLADGRNTVEVLTSPGDQTMRVTIPPFEGSMSKVPETSVPAPPPAPEVVVDTSQGPITVLIDGPIIDGKQDVTIETPDGSVKTTTVTVVSTSDGKNELEIPGPDGTTTTVTEPTTTTEGEGGFHQQVSVMTATGLATVTTDGPVIDGKQEVTITTSDGGSTTTTVEVTPTSDGKNALEIPTGPEGQSTIVTMPQNPTEGGAGSFRTNPTEGGEGDMGTKILVETNHGPATVMTDGPVINGKQEVTITTPDGGTTTTTVAATQTTDGKTELEIPTGPGGTTTTVIIPALSTEGGTTTTDILNRLGGNDIDNGDKDFMSKDEFQLQVGTHYAEKIKALQEQAKNEEAEIDKLLNRQQQLQDCILQAANKFGYYGVYEQPPHFQNAVNWVDNDCLKV